MPKTPIDYSKTIIYRIVCKDPTIKECYVGSTTDFKNRKKDHKSLCNNINDKKYNYNVYQFIRNNGGWENWDMIEIEKYNAIDKLDAHKRERFWLEFYEATLNTFIPSRTGTEYSEKYYQNNKEHQKKYSKEYRQKNKEKVAENSKEQISCECGSICRKYDLNRHKKSKKHLAFTINAINIGNTTGDILFNEIKSNVF